jgi:preprotein translocase subunit YajC
MNIMLGNLPMLQAGAAAGGGGMTTTILTFGLVFVIFYFLIIRPQNKKKKETAEMLKALQKGDKIVTIGGIRGTIQSVKEETVTVKIDTNVKIVFSRSAIASVTERKSDRAAAAKIKPAENEKDTENEENSDE